MTPGSTERDDWRARVSAGVAEGRAGRGGAGRRGTWTRREGVLQYLYLALLALCAVTLERKEMLFVLYCKD